MKLLFIVAICVAIALYSEGLIRALAELLAFSVTLYFVLSKHQPAKR